MSVGGPPRGRPDQRPSDGDGSVARLDADGPGTVPRPGGNGGHRRESGLLHQQAKLLWMIGRSRGVDPDAVGAGGDRHARFHASCVAAALHAAGRFESPITNRVASSMVFRSAMRRSSAITRESSGRMVESGRPAWAKGGTTGIPSHTASTRATRRPPPHPPPRWAGRETAWRGPTPSCLAGGPPRRAAAAPRRDRGVHLDGGRARPLRLGDAIGQLVLAVTLRSHGAVPGVIPRVASRTRASVKNSGPAMSAA